jgi:hypothetical protein
MDQKKNKKWTATEMLIVRKNMRKEIYEANLMSVARVIYGILTNQIEQPNEPKFIDLSTNILQFNETKKEAA